MLYTWNNVSQLYFNKLYIFLKKGKLKRLPFKIHKELLHLNDKKKQPNSKMGKELNGHFSKEELQVSNRDMKNAEYH